jgi:hypothetical protein
MANFLYIVYLAVTLVCVIASGYALYEGAEPLLGWLALPIAIVSGLALLACDLQLRSAIKKGDNPLGLIAALLLVTLLSWTFLFSHFYGSAMRDDIVGARLFEAADTFDNNVSEVRKAVDAAANAEGLEARHTRIQELKANMGREALDRRDCGVGPQTREYLRQINALLRTPINDLGPPSGCAPNDIRDWLSDYNTAIDDQLKVESGENRLLGLRPQLDAAVQRRQAIVTNAELGDINAKRAAIMELEALTRDLERKANEILLVAGQPTVTLVATNTSRDALRNITEVMQSAFVDQPNLGMTIYAALLALMVDLFPMILAFVLFRRSEEIEKTDIRKDDLRPIR